ncbi:MAG TPA: hypothetical protein VG347_04400, partial [Verrucomicrobiae bacterium]|nr:hypothetical protein [Verrucomicrobiae bacterium]
RFQGGIDVLGACLGFVQAVKNYMGTPQIRISIGTIPSFANTKLSERASPIQISTPESASTFFHSQ